MPSVSSSRLILAGVAAPVISWGLSVVVIATWPGYDPLSQSISLLANAPLGWLQTVAFAAGGCLGLAWAVGLSSVLGATRRDRVVVRALLLVQALITFAFAIFPTDPTGTPMSVIGRLHLADFYAYSVTMPLTLLVVGFVMRRDPRWQAAARPTLLAAALVILATLLVPLTVDGPLTPWLGLLERLYVAIPSVWQLGVGMAALRRTSVGSKPIRATEGV
ncbi:MAG: DUF998 domain-containing protein [Chloroflexota bacterium]